MKIPGFRFSSFRSTVNGTKSKGEKVNGTKSKSDIVSQLIAESVAQSFHELEVSISVESSIKNNGHTVVPEKGLDWKP